MSKRIFIGNPDGEGPFYCGSVDDLPDLRAGVLHIVMAELDELIAGHVDSLELMVEAREMSDAEVAALPDIYGFGSRMGMYVWMSNRLGWYDELQLGDDQGPVELTYRVERIDGYECRQPILRLRRPSSLGYTEDSHGHR